MTRLDRWAKNYAKWRKSAKFEIRFSILVATMLLALVFSTVFGFRGRHADEPVELGVSFSIKYARELGNDWKANFLALTDEVQVERMRLMSYWDLIEPQDNQYDFTDLDWQMDQAERHQVKVALAIGQRQPRWPECHVPEWVNDESAEEREDQLLEYIATVVERYKDNPALESYQLENEAANNLFGECPTFDPNFLAEELALVKKLDPNNDVTINTSNQSGIPIFSGVGDRTGFSVYNHAYFEAFGRQMKWDYGYVPAWWHSLRAGLVEGIHQNPTFIHELQTEPWGPVATKDLTEEQQDQLMNSEKLIETVDFALDTGMRRSYLWGGEWWYYRKENFNDKELWQTVKNLYKSNHSQGSDQN
jgi:hypothetical protein